MPGTLIKFSFAILQSCHQRIVVLDMYIKRHSIFKKRMSVFFSTQNFVHEFMRDILSLYCIVYNYSLLTALQNCKCEFNQGSRHSSIFEFEFVWQKFPYHALTFLVFDSIDKYRIDSDRIIFKILRKKIVILNFPPLDFLVHKKKNKRKFVRFFLPFLFLYIPCLRKHSPNIDMQLYINSNFLLKGLKQNLY